MEEITEQNDIDGAREEKDNVGEYSLQHILLIMVTI